MALEGAKRKMAQERLLGILACPVCKGKLELRSLDSESRDFLFCSKCGQEYRITDGIPNVLPPELRVLPDQQTSQADLSIKKANMGYGYVYQKEDATPTKATIVSCTCLVPRSRDFILQHLKGPDSRILETCCAQGTTASFLYDNGYKPFCFDISDESLASLRKHHPQVGDLFIADAENMPIRDGSFNTVLFNGALHHLPHPRKALTESFRVLESGGQVILVEPNSISNEIMRIMLKAFTHPRAALKDLRHTWDKVSAKLSGKDTIERDGEKYQQDGDGRWIKSDEMDQEISVLYILRIARSIGFKVQEVHTYDIALVPFELFNPNPGVATRQKLQRFDAILEKIPLVKIYGSSVHILLQKP